MRGLSRRGMLIGGVTALAGLGGAIGLIEEGVLPGVVMLHGSAGDARTPFDVYGVQYYLADAVRTGTRPFAVVGIAETARRT
jgi:hypothetical protein